MTDTVNFSELSQVKANQVEKPKALPKGHYIAQWAGPMTQHKAKSGNVAMRFPFKLAQPGDDIDEAELAAAGGLPDKTFTLDFWMSPDARFRFTEFCCKAQGLSDELNLIELAEQLLAENKPFTVENNPAQSERDPDLWYNNFDNPGSVA